MFPPLGVALSNIYILQNNKAEIYPEIQKLPDNRVGIVLGCGIRSRFYNLRLQACVELFKSGKIEHIIASGDNHRRGYDEPTAMKNSLMQMGIPEEAITCDYAGFRTLDSIHRVKSVFGLRKVTIISQRFHLYRSLQIAKAKGIEAVGYAADDPPPAYMRMVQLRELAARTVALIDLYITRRAPRFPGPYEPLLLSFVSN